MTRSDAVVALETICVVVTRSGLHMVVGLLFGVRKLTRCCSATEQHAILDNHDYALAKTRLAGAASPLATFLSLGSGTRSYPVMSGTPKRYTLYSMLRFIVPLFGRRSTNHFVQTQIYCSATKHASITRQQQPQ